MKRITGMILLLVEGGNPNGDANTGEPRVDSMGHGFIHPASLKRKCRNPFEDHESLVFLTFVEKYGFDPNRFWIAESLLKGFDVKDGLEAKKAIRSLTNGQISERFIDIRWFGGGIAEEKENEDEENESLRIWKTGVIQPSPLVSLAPIEIGRQDGTRKVSWRTDVLKKHPDHPTDMGMSYTYVEHGLYVGTFTINPAYAHRTHTSQEDIDLFLRVLPLAYSINESASRPGGTVQFIHIWCAEHDSAIGSFNEFDFWNAMKPKLKISEPRSLNDYEIPTQLPESFSHYSGETVKMFDLCARG